MTVFDEIKNKYELEEQANKVNKMMKQTNTPYKNSKRFAKETGLGVIFSVVEKYFLRNGYSFINDEFVKLPAKEIEPVKKESVNEMIVSYLINKTGKGKHTSVLLADQTEKELKEFYDKYPYFNKSDLLNLVILEGVKNLK